MSRTAVSAGPQAAAAPGTRSIVVEEVLPHAPAAVWKALTTGALIARWMMAPAGFEAVVGNRFTFTTTPAGGWDGIIRCEVLDVVENERLVYSWKGGHAANTGYGSLLDTVVTMTLAAAAGGTRLRVVHSGFLTPANDTAYRNMSDGWKKILPGIADVAAGNA